MCTAQLSRGGKIQSDQTHTKAGFVRIALLVSNPARRREGLLSRGHHSRTSGTYLPYPHLYVDVGDEFRCGNEDENCVQFSALHQHVNQHCCLEIA